MINDEIVGTLHGKFIHQSELKPEIERDPDFEFAPEFEFLRRKAWCNNCGRHSTNEKSCSFCGFDMMEAGKP